MSYLIATFPEADPAGEAKREESKSRERSGKRSLGERGLVVTAVARQHQDEKNLNRKPRCLVQTPDKGGRCFRLSAQ